MAPGALQKQGEKPSKRSIDMSYPTFPKGDVRRLLVLALAIAELPRPTLTSLSSATGQHKQCVKDDAEKLGLQLGIQVEKTGPVYSIASWGPLFNVKAVRTFIAKSD